MIENVESTIREHTADMTEAERQAYSLGLVTGLEASVGAVDHALVGHRSSPGSTAVIDALVATSRVVVGAVQREGAA